MAMENTVAVQMPPAELQEVLTKVGEISTILAPYLISLTGEQRLRLPKMGDGTEPFVKKTIDYAKSDPAFLPPYVKVEDIEIDFKAVGDLLSVFRPLNKLLAQLDDTITASGSEAFVGSLSYYNSVKFGARSNAAGAKTIYEDLRKRFEGQGKKASNGEASS